MTNADTTTQAPMSRIDNEQTISKLASALGVDTTVNSTSDLIKRIASQEETDRAVVVTSLLNVFTMAAQRLGGRQMMNHRDFMAFGMALAALDTIEVHDPQTPQSYAGNGQQRA